MLEELIEKFRKSFTTLTCLMVVLDKHINSLHKHLVDKTVEVVPPISVQVVPGISVEVVPL